MADPEKHPGVELVRGGWPGVAPCRPWNAFGLAGPDGPGAFVMVVAGGGLAAVGLPRQAVAFAGGYVFGAWAGAGLSLLAQILGCAADFYGARLVARGFALRWLRGRLAGVDRFLVAHPFSAVLTLRLLPVGNNVVLNVLAGVSGLPAAPFLLASVIGYVPQTMIFALAGSGVQVGRSTQLMIGAALFVASAALGGMLLARSRRVRAAAEKS